MVKKLIGLAILACVISLCGCADNRGTVRSGGSQTPVFVPAYVSPEQFGAVGDREHDDTVAIQNAIDSLGEKGGTVLLGGRYLVDSNNLVVKPNVTLFWREGVIGNPGTGNNVSQEAYIARSGQIVLNPAYTVIMQGSSSIKGVMFWKKGLVIPDPNGASFAGTCIDIKGEDCYVGYSFLVGFNQGILSRLQQRLRVEFVQGDCTNGIWVDGAYDIVTIANCHFWPFASTGAGKGFWRDGVAYN